MAYPNKNVQTIYKNDHLWSVLARLYKRIGTAIVIAPALALTKMFQFRTKVFKIS